MTRISYDPRARRSQPVATDPRYREPSQQELVAVCLAAALVVLLLF